jgi:hypothetical protein
MCDKRLVGLLHRDRVNAPRLLKAIGETILKEPEEGIDSRKASVARSWAVTALDFEMFEESEYEFRVYLLDRDRGRPEVNSGGGKDDEQLEAGRVSFAGVWAGTSVAGQMIAKEGGEVGAKNGHDGSPICKASPAAAIATIKVGVACRYQ